MLRNKHLSGLSTRSVHKGGNGVVCVRAARKSNICILKGFAALKIIVEGS